MLEVISRDTYSDETRGRSRREKADDREDGHENKGFLSRRGRSSSRSRENGKKGVLKEIRRSVSRSVSRVRSKIREKTSQRHGDETQEASNRYKLPKLPLPGKGKIKSGNENKLPPKVEKPKDDPEEEFRKIMRERGLLVESEVRTDSEKGTDFCNEASLNQIKSVDSVEILKKNSNKQEEVDRYGLNSLTESEIKSLDEGNTNLHVACLLHHPSKTIFQHLKRDNNLAKIKNRANETPLHYAAMDRKGANQDVVDLLLKIYPEAVKLPNIQKSLPVHLACMAGAPSSYIIENFLKIYPGAVMVQSDFPLMFDESMVVEQPNQSFDESTDGTVFAPYDFNDHNITAVQTIASLFACAAPNQAAIELREERYRKKEQFQQKLNRYKVSEDPMIETGFSPLHLAVLNNASSAIIEKLIKADRLCLHLKTSQGRTALDCAQYIVKQHWLYGSETDNVTQNIFATIDLLETEVRKEKERFIH